MIASWAAKYVGIPFKEKGRDFNGCDCYGLVSLCLANEFGVNLPSYVEDYVTTSDRAEIAALLRGEVPRLGFRPVARADARAGHAVVLRIEGAEGHVGVMVSRDWFLNVRYGVDAVIERLDAPFWRRKLVGIYEYVGVMA